MGADGAHGGTPRAGSRAPIGLVVRVLRGAVGRLPLDARRRRANPPLAAGPGAGAVRARLARRTGLGGQAGHEDLDDELGLEPADAATVEVRRGDELDGRGDLLAP